MFHLNLGSSPGRLGMLIACDHESSLSYGGRGVKCMPCQTHSVSSEPLPHTAFLLSLHSPGSAERGKDNKGRLGRKFSSPISLHKAEVTSENQTYHPRKHNPCLYILVRFLSRPLFATTPSMVQLGIQTSSGSGVSCVNKLLRAQTTPAELLKSQQWLGLLTASCCFIPWTLSAQFPMLNSETL